MGGINVSEISESGPPGISTTTVNNYTVQQIFSGGTSTSGQSNVNGQSTPSGSNPPPSGVIPPYPPTSTAQATGNFVQFSTTYATYQVCAGPDGNVWFVELAGDKVGYVTPAGVVTEYSVTTASSNPYGICTGPDGNVWFTERTGENIAKVVPSTGAITEYSLPAGTTTPIRICAGPDGHLWAAAYGSSQLVKITTAGVMTTYDTPTASAGPFGICVGPDGRIWFTEASANNIAAFDISTGKITEYPVTVPSYLGLWDICQGADGNLWFTMRNVTAGFAKVGKITTSGTVTLYTLSTTSTSPSGIAAGPDGNIWFTEAEVSYSKIASITPQGTITEYQAPASSGPNGICVGPDGNLWIADDNADVARMNINTAFGNVQTDGYVYQKGINYKFVSGPSPGGTTSTTGVMVGLGSTDLLTITPDFSGRIRVHAVATASNSTATDGVTVRPYYGTGTPPANGAAITGTAFAVSKSESFATAGEKRDLMWIWEIPGLTVGTAYWFDLSLAAVTGGTATVANVMFWVEEF